MKHSISLPPPADDLATNAPLMKSSRVRRRGVIIYVPTTSSDQLRRVWPQERGPIGGGLSVLVHVHKNLCCARGLPERVRFAKCLELFGVCALQLSLPESSNVDQECG